MQTCSQRSIARGSAGPTVSRIGVRIPGLHVHHRPLLAARATTEQYMAPAWSTVTSEQKFFEVLQGEVAAGRCPKQLVPLWQDFYNNYRNALLGSKVEGVDSTVVAKIQSTIADCVLKEFVQPYTFPSHHQRLLEPYNYFEFGQRYVGSLTDFDNSVLGYPERWGQVDALLKQGHNVVLLANHQTEADPGVFAHMLASAYPRLSTDVIYVAGDRVVTDAMCKPFSMGRNLFCVHSRKRMDDEPELKQKKMETNRKTLIAMQRRLNEGGTLIWIAPSGGRDRTKDGVYTPAPFDPSSVELMRNLITRAKQPGHLFPMAMFSWPMMPPPAALEVAVGERRITNFTPVGISLCEELPSQAAYANTSEMTPALREEQQQKLAAQAEAACAAEYKLLERAIRDPQFRAANARTYAQPWAKAPALV